MWNLIKMGGVPGMLFIVLVGLAGLGTAFYFALRPSRRNLGFIRGMAIATLFGTLALTCADVGATFNSAVQSFEEPLEGAPPGAKPPTKAEALPRALQIVFEGCSESTSPGVLGFGMLALTGMLVGVGRRRLDARPDVLESKGERS
jgi:hypothetical protein